MKELIIEFQNIEDKYKDVFVKIPSNIGRDHMIIGDFYTIIEKNGIGGLFLENTDKLPNYIVKEMEEIINK